jgi:16S rRNA (guanine(966)-N(2))-methyltransferase RsmD
MVGVTGGRFKGLRLVTPGRMRATEAKVRQALFNILAPVIRGARVLDGFAGSGAIGIEALSRGAASAAFLEEDAEAVVAIQQNLQRLGPEVPRTAWRVLHLDIERGLRQLARDASPFDLIILDPPYRSEEGKKALISVVDCAMLTPAGLVVIEHDQRSRLPPSVGPLQQGRQHRYGDTVLSFYQALEPS